MMTFSLFVSANRTPDTQGNQDVGALFSSHAMGCQAREIRRDGSELWPRHRHVFHGVRQAYEALEHRGTHLERKIGK